MDIDYRPADGNWRCRYLPCSPRTAPQGVLVADKGLVRFQKVSLGLNDGKKIAVLEGLKEGQLVVIDPAGIRPGQKIRPEVRQAAQRD